MVHASNRGPCCPMASAGLKCAKTCSAELQPVPITSAVTLSVCLCYTSRKQVRRLEYKLKTRKKKCDRVRLRPKEIKEAEKEWVARGACERAKSECKEMKMTGEWEGGDEKEGERRSGTVQLWELIKQSLLCQQLNTSGWRHLVEYKG